MASINLGKVALKWRGAYNAATTYAAQDVVNYGGSSYICKQDNVANTLPTNATYWDLFAQGVEGITQNAGEILYYNGSQLVALPIGSNGQVLTVGSNGLPQWKADDARSGMRAVGIQDHRAPYTYRRNFAIMSDGSMRAWGRGENWLLGQGNNTNDRSYPIKTAFPFGAAGVAKAYFQHDYQAVAIDTLGKLWVWGQNDYGDVGNGGTGDVYVPYCASDNSSNSIFNKTVIDYAPMTSPENYNSTLVLCSDGTVHAAGYNGYGQLGVGDTNNRSNFVQVPLLTGITKIARGRERYTSCLALKSDGTVYSWGYNGNGELGQNNTTQYNIPTLISAFSGKVIVDIGCGGGTAWAIDSTGQLYTWGYNGYGNLGHSGTTQINVPTAALAGVKLCYMSGQSGDYNRTYAIKTDGSLWAAGDNSYGCLGVAADETDRSSFNPCKKNTGAGFTNASLVIAAGGGSYNSTNVLCDDGSVWGVGYSGNGNLGTGSVSASNYWFQPVLIHRRAVIDIGCVGTSSEAGFVYLLDDGQVMQTGYAGEAQLPEDDAEWIAVPMPVIF